MPSPLMTMEDCSVVKGVFLYTKNLDSELMVRCLQNLLTNFPDMMFTSVAIDEKFYGYRVHFCRIQEEAVLAKKLLLVSGQEIRICPLTTYLTILDIDLMGGSQLESDIRAAIADRFGKLVCNVSDFPDRRIGDSADWHVYLDIPEVNELDVFDHEGFSEMCMWLPNKKGKLKVTFCCRRCKKNGHVLQECHQEMLSKEENADEKTELNVVKTELLPTNSVKPSGFCFESTKTYAEKLGREEIMKAGILLEDTQPGDEARQTKPILKTKASNGNSEGPLDFSSIKFTKETEVDINAGLNDIKPNSTENLIRKSSQKQDGFADHLSNQNMMSSPTTDNDIEIIAFREKSLNSKLSLNVKLEVAESENSHEASTPATPSKSNYNNDNNSSAAFSPRFDASPAGPSRGGQTLATRSSCATNVLSKRLQTCIDRSCEMFGVLDRKTLDAFLIHVKKKSNPIRVASNYTINPSGLKEQLLSILKLYYNTPETGTKEDIQFIKWLKGLVDRFEGTAPRKRKRGDQNLDDSPPRKI